MNNLYTKGLKIDWDKISDDSYLHEEAECYKVMEMFINHKDNVVKELLL